jgi:hypothetical protein
MRKRLCGSTTAEAKAAPSADDQASAGVIGWPRLRPHAHAIHPRTAARREETFGGCPAGVVGSTGERRRVSSYARRRLVGGDRLSHLGR